jgi:hypothetical protein
MSARTSPRKCAKPRAARVRGSIHARAVLPPSPTKSVETAGGPVVSSRFAAGFGSKPLHGEAVALY